MILDQPEAEGQGRESVVPGRTQGFASWQTEDKEGRVRGAQRHDESAEAHSVTPSLPLDPTSTTHSVTIP